MQKHLGFAWRRASLTVALVFSGLGLSACEKDEPENEQDFCTQYAERECAPLVETCAATSAAGCVATRKAACTQFIAGISAPSRQFRPANGKACLDQVEATFKKTIITGADLAALRTTCSRVIEGNVAANMACAVNQDCASPLICDKNVCGAVRQVVAGGNCANPGDTCVADEICQPTGAVFVCTPKRAKGETCGPASPCKTALRCQVTCQDKLTTTGECSSDDDCQSGYCNLYPPAGNPRTCLPHLQFAAFTPSCTAYFGAPGGGGDAGAGN